MGSSGTINALKVFDFGIVFPDSRRGLLSDLVFMSQGRSKVLNHPHELSFYKAK